jgi:transposase-like protein
MLWLASGGKDMSQKEDNLILDPDEKGSLKCPKCGSQDWVKDGTSLTFVFKTYECRSCGQHWIMFDKEIKESVEKLNK